MTCSAGGPRLVTRRPPQRAPPCLLRRIADVVPCVAVCLFCRLLLGASYTTDTTITVRAPRGRLGRVCAVRQLSAHKEWLHCRWICKAWEYRSRHSLRRQSCGHFRCSGLDDGRVLLQLVHLLSRGRRSLLLLLHELLELLRMCRHASVVTSAAARLHAVCAAWAHAHAALTRLLLLVGRHGGGVIAFLRRSLLRGLHDDAVHDFGCAPRRPRLPRRPVLRLANGRHLLDALLRCRALQQLARVLRGYRQS